MEVSLVTAYWGLAGFLVLVGTLVLAARPGERVNQLFFALMLLEAAADVAFQYWREAPTDAAARHFSRLAHWYFIPEMFVTLWLLRVLPPVRRDRPWRLVLGLAAALSVARLGLLLSGDPSVEVPFPQAGAANYRVDLGTLMVRAPFDFAVGAVHALAIWGCGHEAVSPQASVLQRKKAATIGLAFVFLSGASAFTGILEALYFQFWLTGPAASGGAVRALLLHAVWAPVVALSLPRLAGAFGGRGRTAYLGVAGAVIGLAVVGWGLGAVEVPSHWTLLGLGNGRIFYVAGFAACFAVAMLRYDVAGFGAGMRRRINQLAFATLAGAVLLFPAGLALAVAAGDAVALAAAVFLAGAALALTTGPLRDVAARAARALLVPPEDPGALGERARLYGEALERRLGPDGALREEDETTLRALRRELDITEREHALLLETLRQRRRGPHAATPAVLGRYVVQRELGRGAFGTALLATDPVTGKDVVLKRFHAGRGAKRALAEARALKAVRHPRVLPLLDVQEAGEEVFLVLAYAEGGNLAQLLAREGPLDPARAGRLAADLLEGLGALHAAGLVHRDVKPSNILLDRDGRAMLGDFGAARFVAGAEAEVTVTGTDVLGSLVTVAPEVLAGSAPAPENDLYAAAAVVYRALTGEHYLALEGKNAFQARQAILHDKPRLPHPRVPAGAARVLQQALAKDPAQRPEDAPTLAAALRRGLAAAPGPVPPASRSGVGRAARSKFPASPEGPPGTGAT